MAMVKFTPDMISGWFDKYATGMEVPEGFYGTEVNSYGPEPRPARFVRNWDDAEMRVLYAAPWGYKDFCFTGDMRVPTSVGMLRMDDLPIGRTSSGVTLYDSPGMLVSTDSGLQRSPSSVCKGIQSVVELRTVAGHVVRCTPDHKIKVYTDKHVYCYKRADEITDEDYIPVNYGQNVWSSEYQSVGDVLIDEDWAWLIGFYMGDGGAFSNGRQITFTSNSLANPVMVRAEQLCEKFFGKSTSRVQTCGTAETYVCSRRWWKFFVEELGIGQSKKNFAVPEVIFKSPRSVVSAFICGLIDSDGTVTHNTMNLRMISEQLIRDVGLLSLNLGSPVSVRYSWSGRDNEQNVWELNWLKAADSDYSWVSLTEPMRAEKFAGLDFNSGGHGRYFPQWLGLARQSKQFVTKLVECVDVGLAEVYDRTVPEGHLYHVNGFSVSNTGNQTMPLLYQFTNTYERDDKYPFIAERSHFPSSFKDLNIMTKHGVPMFGLESRHSMSNFDIVCFSLGYPPFFANVVKQLRMSGIPVRWQDRAAMKEPYPLIFAGGSLYGSPEPWTPVVDLVFVGEAEDEPNHPGLMAVYEDMNRAKQDGSFWTAEGREEMLHMLAVKYDFLYVPRFITPVYNEQNYIDHWDYKYDDIPKRIKKRHVFDLNGVECITHPCIPFKDPSMGLGEIELARGCAAGNCTFSVSGDTLVSTDNGLVRMDVLAMNAKELVSCGASDTEHCGVLSVDVSLNVLGESGLTLATAALDEGVHPVVRIVDEFGHNLDCTPEHLVRVRNFDGSLSWVAASKLEVGQRLAFRVGSPSPVEYQAIDWEPEGLDWRTTDRCIPGVVDETLGWLLGYLVGDGCILKKDKGIVLSCSDDFVMDKVDTACNLLFGSDSTRWVQNSSSEKVTDVYVYSTVVGRFFREFLHMDTASKLAVPDIILRSPHSVAMAFVSGLVDADGHVNKNNFYVTTKSERLAVGLSSLLTALGVRTSVRFYDTHRAHYRVNILKSKLSDLSGLCLTEAARVAGFGKWVSVGGSCVADKFDDRDWQYPRVVGVEPQGVGRVYDLTVPDGEAFVANGFLVHNCAVGFRYRPYRERNVDYMVENMRENIKNSGSLVAFPCAFEYSGHTQKKLLTKRLLEEVCDSVDTQSQRIDNMANDPNFVLVAGEGGMHQLAVGVEGNSERMRTYVNKGATEEKILKAVENALRAGFRKIKLYMIADLPLETQEDTDQIVALCAKIMEMRDSIGSKAQIRASWTPLFIEAWTPLQWNAPTLMEKKLSGVSRSLRDLGVGFSLGKKAEANYSWSTQVVHLCDRIAAEALVDSYEELDSAYEGAVDRKMKDTFEKHLKKRGVSYEHYFQDKPKDFNFPWDIIDIGVTKEFMWKMKIATETAAKAIGEGKMDPTGPRGDGFVVDKCFTKCTSCGVCDVPMKKTMRDQYACSLEDEQVDLGKINIIDQTTRTQKLRFRVYVDPHFRFLQNDYWRAIIRRAAYLTDVPITKRSVRQASETVKWKNWIAGIDYIEFALLQKVVRNKGDIAAIIEKMNTETELYGMKLLAGEAVPVGADSLQVAGEYHLYEISTDRDLQHVKNAITAWNESEYVKMSLKTNNFRVGIVTEIVNAKDYVKDLWAVKDGVDIKVVMYVKGQPSPFDIYCALFGSKSNEAYARVAVKLDDFVEQDQMQADFFRPVCEDCGETVPVNYMDKPLDRDRCPRCKDEFDGRIIV